MAFPTLQFAYFFVVTATISWSLQRWRTAQKVFLVLASFYFYARFEPKLSAMLAGVSVADWLFARAIAKAPHPRDRKIFVTLGVLANVSLLGFFKLYDFFRASTESFAGFLGLSAHLPVLEVLLPVGISFYTFQGIAYLVDTYRGKAVEASLLDFLLFMTFFPKLLSGPICRSQQLLPQIASPSPSFVPDASRAIVLIASGLFKKMVLASLLATRMVDDAFIAPQDFSSLELLVAVYAYTALIYLDFSGYTDMARGLSLLLGFELPENFKYPYASPNIGEFWKRWHITFSSWLRDYVYFPLGGSHVSRPRAYLNLVITFLVCGIWHGSAWTFVVWGLIHGVGLAGYRMTLDLRRDRGIDVKAKPSLPWFVLGCAATVSFCAFARIFFKSSDFATAGEFFSGLTRLTVRGQGIDGAVVLVTVVGIALNFVGKPIYEACIRWQERVPTFVRPVVWAGVGLAMITIKTRDVAPYIYFGF